MNMEDILKGENKEKMPRKENRESRSLETPAVIPRNLGELENWKCPLRSSGPYLNVRLSLAGSVSA